MILRLVLGLLITVVGLAIAGRRVVWLYRLISSGQPVSDRIKDLRDRVGTEIAEVAGQRKLLKWTGPGLAHFFTMWGFLILGFTVVETWGALFDRDFSFWWFGHARWLGFLEDFFIVAVMVAIVAFAIMRTRQAPERRAARVPVLRLAHRCRVGGAVDDPGGHGDAADRACRAVQHRPLPLLPQRLAVRVVAGGARPFRRWA